MAVALNANVAQAADALPSWNKAKTSIVEFVAKVTIQRAGLCAGGRVRAPADFSTVQRLHAYTGEREL